MPTPRVIVTWLIIALNLSVWLLMELNGGSENGDTLIAFGAKVNELISSGEVWRLFTAMFLHIGIFHLAINAYSLYNVGALLERFIGSFRFAVVYVLSGLCGSLASYVFSPHAISAGASGAIFGLLGALGVFFFLHRRLFGSTAHRILVNIVVVALINLSLGLKLSGIDNFAHMGGLLGGIVVGAILTPRYEVRVDGFGAPTVGARATLLSWLLVILFVMALSVATLFAIQQVSDSAGAHLQRGEQFYRAEQFADATSELQQALARDPNSFEAAFYLGTAQFKQRDFVAASDAFEKALLIQNRSPEARFNLALCYIQLRRYADARVQLQQYLSLPNADRAEANRLLAAIANQ